MTGTPSSRLAIIPSAPLLLPGATGSRPDSEVDRIRTAVRGAVSWLVVGGAPIAVVTHGRPALWEPARVSAAELGLQWQGLLGAGPDARAARTDYPVGLIVAAAYVGQRIAASYTTDGTPIDRERGSSLLVVGSGSARRRDGAPGYVDERAIPHDDAVLAALRDGDRRALRALDVPQALELLDDLAAPLRAIADLLTEPVGRWIDYADDPFGVNYVVARWQL